MSGLPSAHPGGQERAENRTSKASVSLQEGQLGQEEPWGWVGGPYQVVVGAKGSPELSSECVPDVNGVLPAAAGHAERDMNTEAPRAVKGRGGSQLTHPLS